MAVSKITGADLFIGNRIVAVVHHGVSPHRSAVAAVDELNAEVASAVGSLVNVFASVGVLDQLRQPAIAMLIDQHHDLRPRHVVSGVRARPFLFDIGKGDDPRQIWKFGGAQHQPTFASISVMPCSRI